MLCWLVLAGLVLMVVFEPRFEAALAEMDMELPTLVVWLVNTARWLRGTLYDSQVVPGIVYVGVPLFAAMAALVVWRANLRGMNQLSA